MVGNGRDRTGQVLLTFEDRTAARSAEEAVQRSAEEKAALAEIGRIVSSSLDLRKGFARFAGQVRRLLEFDRIVLTSIDEAAGTSTDTCVHGVEVEGYPEGGLHPLDGSPLKRALRRTTPYVMDDLEADQDTDAAMAPTYAAGLRSSLVAPLVSDGRVIGTLNLKSSVPDAYGEEELALAGQVAGQVAGAIAASYLHARTVQLAEERELRVRAETEKQELERVSAAKSRFLSTVSHELRTPLATILGFADVLSKNRSGNLDQKQVEQVGLIQRNGRRLSVLINDLVDVAGIESGRFDIDPADFDAAELLREVAGRFEAMDGARHHRLVTRLPEGPVPIWADRERVAQVIEHLLGNASKYSPAGSQIDLEADADRTHLRVTVRDRGVGIASKDQRELFTSFFRSDNEATRSVSGTGLGLVIAKRIIDLHGGSIAFESQPGVGTTFRFQIPGVTTGPRRKPAASAGVLAAG